jgi:DNA-directed RNA polymerase subunit K/omega
MPPKKYNKKGSGLIIPSESVDKVDTEDIDLDTEDDEIIEKKINRLKTKTKQKDEEEEEDEDLEEEELEVDSEEEIEVEDEEVEEGEESGVEEGEEEVEDEFIDKKKTKAIKTKEEVCIYDYAEQKEDDEYDYDDGIEEEEDKTEIKNKYIYGEDRISKPYLTKYERVRILGTRTQQLLGGAKPMLKNFDKLTPKEMAKMELEKGVVPLIIHRPMPNGTIEVWKANELKIVN